MAVVRKTTIDQRFAVSLAVVAVFALAAMAFGERYPDRLPVICTANLRAYDRSLIALEFVGRDRGPALIGGAMIMIVAMMAPALAEPLLYLWHRSLNRHRARSIALFAIAYLAFWLGALGLAVVTGVLAVQIRATGLWLTGGLLALAVMWQLSPLRRQFLARCHRKPGIAIFGLAALGDPLRYGIVQGALCVATCWGWMLLPFAAPALHVPLTAMTAVVVWRERRATQRSWRPPLGFARLFSSKNPDVPRDWMFA